MAYTKKLIEYLHDTGKMPDWIYYQQNGATAQENYNRQQNRIREQYYSKLLEELLEKELENKIGSILDKLLYNLFLK